MIFDRISRFSFVNRLWNTHLKNLCPDQTGDRWWSSWLPSSSSTSPSPSAAWGRSSWLYSRLNLSSVDSCQTPSPTSVMSARGKGRLVGSWTWPTLLYTSGEIAPVGSNEYLISFSDWTLSPDRGWGKLPQTTLSTARLRYKQSGLWTTTRRCRRLTLCPSSSWSSTTADPSTRTQRVSR